MPLLVTVDTEEDNWLPARSGITVENIAELPRFQALMERLGLRPTYFTAYQVTRVPEAASVLEAAREDGAELASHLHPWNTPPMKEPLGRNTMTANLPASLQRLKLEELTRLHEEVYGEAPLSFRTGRFGFGPELVEPLVDLGYRVDSSVTPYWSWEEFDSGPDFVSAPMEVYQLDPTVDRVDRHTPGGRLLEIPLCCGFNRHPFGAWNVVHTLLRGPVLRPLRAVGVAWKTRLVRRIFLSPELHEVADMVTLSRRLMERGLGYLHLMLHSSTLRAGLTPFTRTARDVDLLLGRIEEYVSAIAGFVNPVAATVAEFGEMLHPEPQGRWIDSDSCG